MDDLGMEPHSECQHINKQELDKHQELVVESKKDPVPSLPQKSTWKGWAEIENDPVGSTLSFSCRHDTDDI